MSVPTEITVRPAYVPEREAPIFGVRTPGDTDRATREDVAKAANPLHYVPFVSQLYESATGNTGSAAMKIIGGALIGGPIGLIAGIANAIFEQETGTTVVASLSNALRGEEAATTQLASAEPAASAVAQTQQAAPVEPVAQIAANQEILPPEPARGVAALEAAAAGQKAQQTQMQLASALSAMGSDDDTGTDAAILSLYGGQPASAHRSYQRAQMLPYLRDVTSSHVI